jgi:UDP-glucose 4-epimerase
MILGAHGFLSTHLQAWCVRNEVPFRAVSSREIDLTQTNSTGQLADLLRTDDAVVMTSLLPPGKGRDYQTLMANLRMTETVVSAIKRSACAHLVNLSSDAVYAASKRPIDESASCEPTDLYALAHIAREMLFRIELERSGIPVCTLRLTAIYGAGDTHNAYGPNRFVREALKSGRIELFGNGEERRSHVYIDDAIELMGRSLKLRSAGTLNVAVRRTASFKQVADHVARLVATPVEISSVPRRASLMHRGYLNTAIFAAFPDFKFTPMKKGLAHLVSAEREAAG